MRCSGDGRLEQLSVWFLVVVALFLAVALIRTVLGLALRYALFVIVALLVYQDRYGTDVPSWMTPRLASEVAIVAGAALVVTAISSHLIKSRPLRFVVVPAIGLGATVAAAHVVAG